MDTISIHPPRAGRDFVLCGTSEDDFLFQSTRPVRGGTKATRSTARRQKFQSTRPVRGGTYHRQAIAARTQFQSTRPVRGGTSKSVVRIPALIYFNPPAPCGAGPDLSTKLLPIARFQSTRPVRGGTDIVSAIHDVQAISIHPPRAGRDHQGRYGGGVTPYFNPPAPCGAGPAGNIFPQPVQEFQSTRPVRGGTILAARKCQSDEISIHPPRAGRDVDL